MRIHRMTVRSVASRNIRSGIHTGFDLNESIKYGRQFLQERWPDIANKTRMECKLGKVPRMDVTLRGYMPEFHIPDDSVGVVGIAIFMHLGLNAWKAGATEFKIKTYTRGGVLAVADITDNGTGIPPHLLGKLFKEGNTFTTENYQGGNGEGLALTSEVITHFGGNIGIIRNAHVGSPHKGPTGVTFRITMPIHGWYVEKK